MRATRQSESSFSASLRKRFDAAGAHVFVCTGSIFQGAGWPDWHVSSKIIHCWLELKVGRNDCSDAQKLKIQQIRDAGEAAFVLRKRDDKTLYLEDPEGVYLCQPEDHPLSILRAVKELWE